MKRLFVFGAIALLANIAFGSSILSIQNNDNYSVTQSDPSDLKKIIELIKSNYKDPNLSKLYTDNPGEKTYKYEDEENVAFQGRACWKTNVQIVLFADDGMGIVEYMKIDLIDTYGGHGRTVYKKGPEGKEMKYILVKDVIYKWTKDDYSDLEEFLIYDSKNDQIKSKDNKKIYKAEIDK